MPDSSDQRICGLYPWFEECGNDLVHPDDISRFRAFKPYGKVFDVRPHADGMLELCYGIQVFRVKHNLFKEVSSPKYRVGDQVEIIGKQGTAVIIEVMWHHKENRPFFQVAVDGRKKSTRYLGRRASVG